MSNRLKGKFRNKKRFLPGYREFIRLRMFSDFAAKSEKTGKVYKLTRRIMDS